jgi:DNA-directed RNA polymerase subunit omega
MAQPRTTLMEPPIEDLLDKVDSKFTLVALAAKRGRQINSYYNQLGEGLGYVVPPQVTSVSGKSLTIAFEEVAAGKAVFVRREPVAEGGEGAEGEAAEGEGTLEGVAGEGVEGAGAEVAAEQAPETGEAAAAEDPAE